MFQKALSLEGWRAHKSLTNSKLQPFAEKKNHNYKTFQINSNKINPQKNVSLKISGGGIFFFTRCFPSPRRRPKPCQPLGPQPLTLGGPRAPSYLATVLKLLGSCLLGVYFHGKMKGPPPKKRYIQGYFSPRFRGESNNKNEWNWIFANISFFEPSWNIGHVENPLVWLWR